MNEDTKTEGRTGTGVSERENSAEEVTTGDDTQVSETQKPKSSPDEGPQNPSKQDETRGFDDTKPKEEND